MCSIHDSFKTSMKQQYHNMMSYFTKSLNYYSSKSPNFPQKEETCQNSLLIEHLFRILKKNKVEIIL